jgi:hypothetical protein
MLQSIDWWPGDAKSKQNAADVSQSSADAKMGTPALGSAPADHKDAAGKQTGPSNTQNPAGVREIWTVSLFVSLNYARS